MNDQLGLGVADRANARRTDPDTSHEAARAARKNLRDTQREVLSVFRTGGAYTDKDLVAHLESAGTNQSRSGIRTRRKELEDAGFVEPAGYRKVNGRRCRRFQLVQP